MKSKDQDVVDFVGFYDITIVAEFILNLVQEGLIDQEDLEARFGDENTLEKLTESDIDSITPDMRAQLQWMLAEAIRTPRHKSASKNPKTTDMRSQALKMFDDLYRKTGKAFGQKEVSFLNSIMLDLIGFRIKQGELKAPDGIKYKSWGRNLNGLRKVIENGFKKPKSGERDDSGFGFATELQAAITHRSSKEKNTSRVDEDSVYRYWAKLVKSASSMSQSNKDWITGNYWVFRLAHSDPDSINISCMQIAENHNGTITTLNKRSNKTGVLPYKSEGLLFQTSNDCIIITARAKSLRDQSENDQWYETITCEVKWPGHALHGPCLHGLYLGLCGSEQHPFSTRVFLLKEEDLGIHSRAYEPFRELMLTVPSSDFTSYQIKLLASKGKASQRGLSHEHAKLLYEFEDTVLSLIEDTDSGKPLTIDNIKSRIVNVIGKDYRGLRQFPEG